MYCFPFSCKFSRLEYAFGPWLLSLLKSWAKISKSLSSQLHIPVMLIKFLITLILRAILFTVKSIEKIASKLLKGFILKIFASSPIEISKISPSLITLLILLASISIMEFLSSLFYIASLIKNSKSSFPFSKDICLKTSANSTGKLSNSIYIWTTICLKSFLINFSHLNCFNSFFNSFNCFIFLLLFNSS